MGRPGVARPRYTQPLHARLRIGQLLSAERHAGNRRAELGGCHLGQCTPAATNLQHPVAGFDVGQRERAAYFGFLCLGHGLAEVATKHGGRVVHGFVQPELVESIAQVVVGVDVFLAVGFGIAVQQMLDTVEQAAHPRAVDHVVHFGTVFHQYAQQVHQIGAGPIACNKRLGKANVARLERGAADIPVVQLQRGVQTGLGTKVLHRAIRQVHGQAAMAQALQQLEHGARSSGRALRYGICGRYGFGGSAIHRDVVRCN